MILSDQILAEVDREERIRRAHEVKQKLLKKLESYILAIGIYGSTARQEDGPYSDLEINVVTREAIRPSRFEFYDRGLRIEVNFYKNEKLRNALKVINSSWPFFVDQFINVTSVYEIDRYWDKIRATIFETQKGSFEQAIHDAIVGEFLEFYSKYMNAKLGKNKPQMRWASWRLVWSALVVIALINKRYYSSSMRAITESLEMPILPDGYADLVRIIQSGNMRDIAHIDNCCQKMVESILEITSEMGISLVKEQIPF